MKLPITGKTQQHGARQGRRAAKIRGGHTGRTPGIVPHAQQGVAECQDRCEELYPDNPIEQLECFKQECWS
jgi:hypothetical protein